MKTTHKKVSESKKNVECLRSHHIVKKYEMKERKTNKKVRRYAVVFSELSVHCMCDLFQTFSTGLRFKAVVMFANSSETVGILAVVVVG